MIEKHRYSKQRALILDAISKADDHPTAEMLHSILRPQYPTLSLGTVYRNLNLLSREGIISKMNFSVERYDFDTSAHPHFCCDQCGQVSDFPSASAFLPDGIIDDGGNKILRCDVIFSGICKKCMSKKQEMEADS